MSVDGPLIDHHCHAVVRGNLDRAAFEGFISESFDPAPAGTSQFDTPIGLVLRRWCAPVLDLEPFVSPEEYLDRRQALGGEEAARRFLEAAGLEALLIDTGYRPEESFAPSEMGSLAGSRVREIVRLESVAESVAAGGPDAGAYPDAFRRGLEDASAGAAGYKTIVAYRAGFDIDPDPPAEGEVVEAAGRWFAEIGERQPRLEDPVLLRFGIWTGARFAAERGFPLQVHAGFGDPDLRINLADPALLTDLIRRLANLPVDLILLHCYPYHRQAAYLASVYPHVYFDLGAALTFTGSQSRAVFSEGMELAPFAKQLYSSDAFGLPEMYHLGAVQYRVALGGVLDGWVADGACSAGEADRIADLIGRGNAARIYPLADGV